MVHAARPDGICTPNNCTVGSGRQQIFANRSVISLHHFIDIVACFRDQNN
jgi:hypothetical protein